jgi:hypothetical protein
MVIGRHSPDPNQEDPVNSAWSRPHTPLGEAVGPTPSAGSAGPLPHLQAIHGALRPLRLRRGKRLAGGLAELQLTANHAAFVNLRNNAGAEILTSAVPGYVQAGSSAYAAGSFASGAMVDLGAIADAAASVGSTGTLSAKLRLMTIQLDTINTSVAQPLRSGANPIGTVNPTTLANWGLAATGGACFLASSTSTYLR